MRPLRQDGFNPGFLKEFLAKDDLLKLTSDIENLPLEEVSEK